MFKIANSKLYLIQMDNNVRKLFKGDIHYDYKVVKVSKLKPFKLLSTLSENIKYFHVPNFVNKMLVITNKNSLYTIENEVLTTTLTNININYNICNIVCQENSDGFFVFNTSVLFADGYYISYITNRYNNIESKFFEKNDNVLDVVVSAEKYKHITLTEKNKLIVHFNGTEKIIDTPFGVKKVVYYCYNYFYLDHVGNLYRINLCGEIFGVTNGIKDIFRSSGSWFPVITFDQNFKILNSNLKTLSLIKTFTFEIIDLYIDSDYYCYTNSQGQLYLSMLSSNKFCKIDTLEPVLPPQNKCKNV